MLNPSIDWHSDPNFVIVDGIPVLDEHELHLPGEDGKQGQTLKVDALLLQQIAANNNRRVLETGDTVMLIEGHTKDDTPEADQPPIVGEADNFRVAPLFNTGRQAIWARFKFKKTPDVLAKLKNNRFPRRSVELWTDKWEIDPIALLGPSAPERDLGVLRLHRIGGRTTTDNGVVRYEIVKISRPVLYASNAMFAQTVQNPLTPIPGASSAAGPAGQAAPMVDPGLLAGVMGGIQQTDTWQQMTQQQMQIQQMLQQIMPLIEMLGPLLGGMGGMPGGMPGMGGPPGMPGMGGPPGMPGGGGMGGGMPGGLDPMALMALMGGMGGPPGMGGGDGRDEGDRVRMDGESPGTSFPSATNTFLPGMGRQRRIPRFPMNYQHNGQTANGQLPAGAVPQQYGVIPSAVPNGQAQTMPLPGQATLPVPQTLQENVSQALVRLQRENQQLRDENQQLRVVMELTALQNEGVILNPQEEYPLLVGQTDEVRALMYQRMRQRYQRRDNRTSLLQQLMQGQGQVAPQQGYQQVPQVPNAPGLNHPVPQQYQRAGTPAGTPRQEPAPTKEENERIIQAMCAARDRGEELEYSDALQLVRYGRNGRGHRVQEPTY